MTTDAQNIFLFVFATMMLAIVTELWSIAKILRGIGDTLERMHQVNQERDSQPKS